MMTAVGASGRKGVAQAVEDEPDMPGLLARWKKRLRESQFSHYAAAEHFSRRNTALGVPVVVLSAIVGSSVVATAQQQWPWPPWAQVLLGCLSLIAGVIAALQTWFGLAEKAEKHRVAAARYGAVRRHAEQTLATLDTLEGAELIETVAAIRAKIDALAVEAPNVSLRLREKGQCTMEAQDRLAGTPTPH
jgi:hypothetical protein